MTLNWIVLDYKGKMLNSCWFASALEAFDAMHQSIRKTLRDYAARHCRAELVALDGE